MNEQSAAANARYDRMKPRPACMMLATTRTARARCLCTLAGLLCATAAGAQQLAPVGEATRDAISLCEAVESAPISERPMVLTAALARAEEAVSVTPQDPVAHFAVFCSLGKRLELHAAGRSLLAAIGDLRRAQRELDVALALAPEYPGALAAKGEMLIRLPWFLGGDREEGERLLQRAVALAPGDPHMRIMLTKALQASSE
jgi:tetratricopeptide (TPR) repeat protein